MAAFLSGQPQVGAVAIYDSYFTYCKSYVTILGVQPPLVLDGAVAALGTRHDKERLISPALAAVGLRLVVTAIDTDAFGTFDASVPRSRSAQATVAAKAAAAAEAEATRLGVASEGSFFDDPAWTLCPTNVELVALVDRDTGLVVIGRSRAPAPWARPGTDLRAHRCPSRRPNIARAATDLAERLGRRCPSCDSPGVGPVRAETGRPCAWCGGPTLDVARVVSCCPACDAQMVDDIDGTADPGTCPRCNP